jgi:hypothetical protein
MLGMPSERLLSCAIRVATVVEQVGQRWARTVSIGFRRTHTLGLPGITSPISRLEWAALLAHAFNRLRIALRIGN